MLYVSKVNERVYQQLKDRRPGWERDQYLVVMAGVGLSVICAKGSNPDELSPWGC